MAEAPITKVQDSSWSYEDGVLAIHRAGKTVSLGRYATEDHAKRAAEKYLANNAANSAK